MSDAVHSVVLHIGAEKTGTKSIQQYFSDRHRGLWHSHRVFYPARGPLFLGSAHFPILTAFLPRESMQFVPPGMSITPEQVGAELRSISRLLKDGSPAPHSILLSAEHFSSRLKGDGIRRLASLLREALPDYRTTIVYQVRSQDGFYSASVSTHLKSAGTGWPSPDSARKGTFYDHFAVAEEWAEAFGREHVRIVNFHKDDAIRAMLSIVAPAAAEIAVPGKYRNNRSLSWEQARILQTINGIFGPPDSHRMMVFRVNYNERVISHLETAPIQRTALTDILPEFELQMFRTEFGASNDRLQQVYRTDFNLNDYMTATNHGRRGHQVNQATQTEMSLWTEVASHAPRPGEGEATMMRYMEQQLRRLRLRSVRQSA